MRKTASVFQCLLCCGLTLSAVQSMAQSFEFFKILSVKQAGTNLEVVVRTGERTRSDAVYAKVYYYDREREIGRASCRERV